MRYGPDYVEEVTLKGGGRVRLRLVRPEDKPLLERGLARLSSESRYRRFFTAKDHFTRAELRYLTECDGVDHLAIGAIETGADGTEEGVGVARFVRVPGKRDVAEAAVAVVDDYHGRGLGRVLLRRLIEAAVERGVTHFRNEVLADNAPMRALLVELGGGDASTFIEEGVATIDLPLHAPSPHVPNPVEHLLALVAEGLVRVRQVLGFGPSLPPQDS